MNDNMTDGNVIFRSETLDWFGKEYMSIHGYLSLLVCSFGIPLNILNITVLTRPHMQTPVNLILTCMAISDVLTMCSYMPFAIHFYVAYPPNIISDGKNSLYWMCFLLFHINFSATTHTVAIWLGVALAIFRYKHLQSPAKGSITRMRRIIRARLVVCFICFGSVILLVPNYVSNTLIPYSHNSTIYILDDFRLGTSLVKPIVLINLLLYSMVAKFLPCVLIVVYSVLLLRTLRRTVRTKQRKRQRAAANTTYCRSTQKSYDTNKTTRMLVVVIVLFLVAELPQTILIILSMILRGFFDHIYIPFGDVMDMLALVNNAVNFVLYCSMSGEFRRTLFLLLRSVTRRKHATKVTTTSKMVEHVVQDGQLSLYSSV